MFPIFYSNFRVSHKIGVSIYIFTFIYLSFEILTWNKFSTLHARNYLGEG